ncbi:ribonuclease H-like domain-containing protein [Paenibacillus sp.]|uniref:ribonuclease H-like domain-containing protein n=1 Tax=Paenibacillus sp. TaxID=58172 RepID=UPI002D2A8FDE|nr:ribonuclease H-like domain-containing protein [Paenibacillus sp.]HZG56036.1 ribonuclease H-like domain-containing protein [Paenibacillus sp.]
MSGRLRERLGRLTGSGARAKPADLPERDPGAGAPADAGAMPESGAGPLPGAGAFLELEAADSRVRDPEAVVSVEAGTSSGSSRVEGTARKADEADVEAAAWAKLGFALAPGPTGACLVREVRYGAAHRHGKYGVSELSSAGAALTRLDPAGRRVEPEKLLFLDTETTGLGQGAGNVPFLIGIGWWTAEGFTVRQYLIRHPGEEAAMLGMLAEALPAFTHLVTYNGRTFDWPLVKNRFILQRMAVPKDPAHFDFLYPSRSLWRTTMPSVRLGAVEEAKLGVFREDDVPGSMAPALYFQYLAERNVSVLEGVVRHNETDIATLLTLAIHFGRLLDVGATLAELPAAELLRLALWYERLGFEDEACGAMEALAERPASEAYACWGEAAQFYKRRKRWAEAVRLWRMLAEETAGRRWAPLEPYVELAMAYEHRLKDAAAALYWTEAALDAAQRRAALAGRAGDGEERKLREQLSELRKRKARLSRKSGAGGLF